MLAVKTETQIMDEMRQKVNSLADKGRYRDAENVIENCPGLEKEIDKEVLLKIMKTVYHLNLRQFTNLHGADRLKKYLSHEDIIEAEKNALHQLVEQLEFIKAEAILSRNPQLKNIIGAESARSIAKNAYEEEVYLLHFAKAEEIMVKNNLSDQDVLEAEMNAVKKFESIKLRVQHKYTDPERILSRNPELQRAMGQDYVESIAKTAYIWNINMGEKSKAEEIKKRYNLSEKNLSNARIIERIKAAGMALIGVSR